LLDGALLAQETQAPAAQSQTENANASQVVHILVGHTVVVRTDTRLRRVLVGNPGVVSTTTTSPNELAITAVGAGSSSVVLWQEDNSSRIVEVFADVDVSMLRDAIRTSFPKETISAEAEEGKVVLTGTASSQMVIDQIAKMSQPFAKDVVNSVHLSQARQRQVLLKVKFAEVDRTKLENFGINILSTGAANTPGAIGTGQFGSTSLGGTTAGLSGTIGAPLKGTTTTETVSDLLNIFLYRPDLNLGATIADLQQRNVVQILAEPNLLATDGQPATFLAGGELPYPVVTGAAGQSTVSVQFKPFGVKLEFTGTIEADDVIRLKVYPEVSTLDYTNAVKISGFTLPAISTRNATSVVELRSGQSFGIAGLLDKRTTAQFSKVPGIGDIPILGQLFRSHSINKTNSELMVIVTPIIVDPASDQGAVPPDAPKQPMQNLEPSNFDQKIPAGGH
jgi:pilus assembly protein CpaC